ncbi:MAG: HAMP domain-containing histidine kinase [Anaerolineae bacterium]|nr:HAMP domain-containing histidine kinase [Anaerolineae bacterium]
MRTLRTRLIVSHVLPLLLIVPLVGVALLYIVETQVILTDLSEELAQHAMLSADLADERPVLWRDAAEAQQFVTWYAVRSRSHVTLLDPQGNVLASSDSGRFANVGYQPQQRAGAMVLPLEGTTVEPQVEVTYTWQTEAELIRVIVPVVGPDREVVGMIRLSRYLGDVGGQLVRLRYLIAAALVGELLLAIGLAVALALNLSRSLQRVTSAVYAVSRGQEWQTLPEEGPEEIRTLLHAFNTLVERLRMTDESRRRLLANLVHELGRPLGAVQSALQALLNGAEEDAALRHELLEGMDDQVHRLRPLLDSLTDLYDQVLGTLELNRRPTPLADWLARTVVPWRVAAMEKGLEWQVDIPGDLPTMRVDPDRLAQVVGNLLSNACKYTPEGGTVSVAARTVGEAGHGPEGVEIIVADTGLGIAPDERTRIFEPFFRSRRERRFPQGMGLGLSIARDLVMAHGGRLDVDSTPGQGSRFSVWLPIQPLATD